jgi:MFS family permease
MIREIRDQLNGRISWKQTFAALKYPNYKLWFWGQMTSLFGTWMQVTALGYLMFDITKSPAFLGYVGFASGVPTWFFMLYAGVVADRMSRRKLMIMTQAAMMALAFILAGLAFAGIVRPWQIIVLAFLGGVTNAFDAPARHAIVQDLVAHEDMTNAIALNSAMFNTATAVGPAVAGVTYALFGPAWCFTINGLSFIAVIAALAAMKLKPRHEDGQAQKSSVLADLKEGLHYVVSHPLIRTIISLVGVITLFSFAFATLIPAWAVTILKGDATTNGLLQSARGFGALASALLIASLGRFKFRGKLLTFGSFAFPALLIVFSFIRSTPLALVGLFCVGFALILIFNLANATVQTLTPGPLRGRVMSVYSFVFFGFMPIGALFIGWLATKFSEPSAILINSVITLAYAGVLFVFIPKLRRLQ